MNQLLHDGRRFGGQLPAYLESLEARRLLAATPSLGAALPLLPAVATADVVNQPRQVEQLDRGVVAIHRGNGEVYISWRLLGLDPSSIGFNLYRSNGGAAPVKLNAAPLTQTTDFVDSNASTGQTNIYTVHPIVDGIEGEAEGSFVLPANASAQPYLSVPLQRPAGRVLDGQTVTYSANDASVGDLNGDGQYEIVLKWDPSNSGDNNPGFRSNVYIDAYELDGTLLWRIDLGRNIRAGAHYTQFQVYDLDSDGRAEVAMRTAPGTIDGQGNPVLLPGDSANADYRNAEGYVLVGPEYLTIFDGFTGGELATAPFVPERGHVSEWGDGYGNRVDRFLAGVAYLNGEHPSLIMGRGYYGPQGGFQARNEVAAYDWREGELSLRWTFRAATNGENSEYIGQGAHSLTIGDVDADGRDEVVYGAAAIDDDGTGLYSTGLGHGDALHMSDMDPTRPGQEIFMVHEDPGAYQSDGRDAGGSLRNAATGELLAQIPSNNDVGRGVAFDIDPNHLGYEMWATTNQGTRMVYNVSGEALYPTPSNMHYNFGVWWDGDPLRESLDGTTISKWRYDWANPGRQNILEAWRQGAASNNGTKSTPALTADLLGDWREEVVWRNSDSTELQIWTTTIPANNRMYTLMHDTQYRVAVAWQNSGYNQPPHPSFYLGAGMEAPPTPNVAYVANSPHEPKPSAWVNYQAELASYGGGAIFESVNSGFRGTGYVNFPANGGFLEFNNVDGGIGGETTINFRYALGVSNTRLGTLLVNGEPQPISFQPTGSWTTWNLFETTLDLLPGAGNTIRFESTGQDLANIDELQVNARRLPEPWEAGEVGEATGGDARWNDGVFTVTGGGADIWGASDAFHYVYQPFSGDGHIVARIDGLDGAHPWSKAGLMLRSSLDSDASNAGVFLTGDRGAAFQYRTASGETTQSLVQSDVEGPYLFRLARRGDVFSGWVSADGQRWESVGRVSMELPTSIYVGLAVTSHDAQSTADAVFSDVEIRRVNLTFPLRPTRPGVGGFRPRLVRSDSLLTGVAGGSSTTTGRTSLFDRLVSDADDPVVPGSSTRGLVAALR